MLRRAADAIPNADGRPLYAGHAELDWPDTPHGQLWHAITLLRENRGDGHIATLVTHGLSGLEALITHIAIGIGFSPDFGRRLRGWSEEQWATAFDGLRDRGILDDAGALTPAGYEVRAKIEDLTDDLAFAPWRSLPDDQIEALTKLAKVIREAAKASGLFPSDAFGPRYGEHR